jgi:hypothetical protein
MLFVNRASPDGFGLADDIEEGGFPEPDEPIKRNSPHGCRGTLLGSLPLPVSLEDLAQITNFYECVDQSIYSSCRSGVEAYPDLLKGGLGRSLPLYSHSLAIRQAIQAAKNQLFAAG